MKTIVSGSRQANMIAYALLLCALPLTWLACKKDDKKMSGSPDATLKIASFDPISGAAGSTVTIKGQAFAAVKTENKVKFKDREAEVLSVNDAKTELTVKVPEGTQSGKISIEVNGKTASSESSFTFIETAPVVEQLTPEKGDVNDIIVIKGKRFGTDVEVYFGGIRATTLERISESELEVAVPAGALNGKVKVKSNSIEAQSAAYFWVRPTITQVTPIKQVEAGVITIEGSNFSNTAAENFVYFGDTRATEITEATPTLLKVKVPAGAKEEQIKVVVMDQEVRHLVKFVFLPTITSFTPATARRGDLITINGKNISSLAKVYIDNLEITSFEAGRTTSLVTFKIPETAIAGKILVKYADVTTEAGDLNITNYWKKITTTTSGNLYDNISFVYNNKIYQGLGSTDHSNGYTRDFKTFNFTTKQWEHAFSAPAKVMMRLQPSAVVHNNKVYIGGGLNIQNSDPYVRDMWEFDPSKASDPEAAWVKFGPAVNPYSAGTFSHNGSLYDEVNGNVSRYNPTTNVWDKVATSSVFSDIVNGRAHVINNEAYYFGGGTRSSNWLYSELTKFNPSTNQITAMKRLPVTILPYAGTTFTLNNKLYAVALVNTSTGDQTTWEYDPATDNWTDLKITLREITLVSSSAKYNSAVVNGKAYIWSTNGIVYEFVP